MQPCRYIRPRTLHDAFAVLTEHGPAARVLAGGTDLLVRLRRGHIRADVVVDVKGLDALRTDVVDDGAALQIGASAVMADIVADARVRRRYPALVEAVNAVGSVQIRNRATLAGNICNASPAADTAPALLVYGAAVHLLSAAGARRVPLDEFFTGPGLTVLSAGELVASIELPGAPQAAGAAFGRMTRRRGVDLATVNLCCLVTAAGETRFAYGAVGPRPFVVSDVSGTLADPGAPSAEKDAVLGTLISHASPISDVRADRDYREAMLRVLSQRALRAARARLGEAGGTSR